MDASKLDHHFFQQKKIHVEDRKIYIDEKTIFVYQGEEYTFHDLFQHKIKERRREKLKNLLTYD